MPTAPFGPLRCLARISRAKGALPFSPPCPSSCVPASSRSMKITTSASCSIVPTRLPDPAVECAAAITGSSSSRASAVSARVLCPLSTAHVSCRSTLSRIAGEELEVVDQHNTEASGEISSTAITARSAAGSCGGSAGPAAGAAAAAPAAARSAPVPVEPARIPRRSRGFDRGEGVRRSRRSRSRDQAGLAQLSEQLPCAISRLLAGNPHVLGNPQ